MEKKDGPNQKIADHANPLEILLGSECSGAESGYPLTSISTRLCGQLGATRSNRGALFVDSRRADSA